MLNTDKGKVFGWGNSEYGQIPGIGDNQQVNIATEIKACDDLGRITDIASGGSFCMVLNGKFCFFIYQCIEWMNKHLFFILYYSDAGEVFVWGYGILGFGPEVRRAMKPTKIPSTLFGINEYDPTVRVTIDIVFNFN